MKTTEEKGMELYPLIPYYDNIASSDEFRTNEIKYIERLAFRKGAEFAQQWISVEDELPKDSEYVLVKDSFGIPYSAYYDFTEKGFCSNAFTTQQIMFITHWRSIDIT